MSDQEVIYTNDESTYCKQKLVEKKYIEDEFVQFFPKSEYSQNSVEINRGYFIRYTFTHQLIMEGLRLFMTPEQPNLQKRKVQIVSLGAGFDTLYFQMMKKGITNIRYVEVDFPTVMNKKIGVISRNRIFKKYIVNPEIDSKNGHLKTETYVCLSCDLRKTDKLLNLLRRVLDPKLPVIVVSEMVLIYMESKYSNRILEFFGKTFSESQIIIYESFNPHDEFGKKMVEKIKDRGCPLLSIYDFDSLEKQENRLIRCGYPKEKVRARDLLTVTKKFFDARMMLEAERRTGEFLDEFYLFNRLMNHYCFLIGLKTLKKEFDPKTSRLFHLWFNREY